MSDFTTKDTMTSPTSDSTKIQTHGELLHDNVDDYQRALRDFHKQLYESAFATSQRRTPADASATTSTLTQERSNGSISSTADSTTSIDA